MAGVNAPPCFIRFYLYSNECLNTYEYHTRFILLLVDESIYQSDYTSVVEMSQEGNSYPKDGCIDSRREIPWLSRHDRSYRGTGLLACLPFVHRVHRVHVSILLVGRRRSLACP